jgi:hypothetical protein
MDQRRLQPQISSDEQLACAAINSFKQRQELSLSVFDVKRPGTGASANGFCFGASE